MANEIAKLVGDKSKKQIFQRQIIKFVAMREIWAQAITTQEKKVKANPKWKNFEAGKPKEDWIWYSKGGGNGFWGPEFPSDPADWFERQGMVGFLFNNQQAKIPNNKHRLMIAYVLLAIIHDGTLTTPIDEPIYFNFTNKGELRNEDEFAISEYESLVNDYNDRYDVGQVTKTKIERALLLVKADPMYKKVWPYITGVVMLCAVILAIVWYKKAWPYFTGAVMLLAAILAIVWYAVDLKERFYPK